MPHLSRTLSERRTKRLQATRYGRIAALGGIASFAVTAICIVAFRKKYDYC
jgi:hypothetical protein